MKMKFNTRQRLFSLGAILLLQTGLSGTAGATSGFFSSIEEQPLPSLALYARRVTSQHESDPSRYIQEESQILRGQMCAVSTQTELFQPDFGSKTLFSLYENENENQNRRKIFMKRTKESVPLEREPAFEEQSRWPWPLSLCEAYLTTLHEEETETTFRPHTFSR